MATKYSSNFDGTVPFSDTCAQVALQANVAETYTLPGASTVSYSLRFAYTYNSNVFIRLNAAPTTPPAGTTTEEPNSEFRPGSDGSKRYAHGGDVIHMVTPDATAYVGISVIQLP